MTVRVIKPKSGLVPIDFGELWEYRERLWFLAWRNMAVRYKQTAIGITWAIIRPLFTMIVLTIIFGNIAKLPSDDIAYPLLVLAGTLPWQLFASSLAESSNLLVTNAAMISKICFPRLVLPAAAVVSSACCGRSCTMVWGWWPGQGQYFVYLAVSDGGCPAGGRRGARYPEQRCLWGTGFPRSRGVQSSPSGRMKRGGERICVLALLPTGL